MSGIKLNLGCGYKKMDGYVNVDDDPKVEPDLMLNLNDAKLPYEDHSVDEVVAYHILEHIGEPFIPLMKEIYRVLKPNGEFQIKFPHHRGIWYANDPTHVREITEGQFQLFSKKYCQFHADAYGSSNGMAVKFDIDFEMIDIKHTPFAKWQERFKTMTSEEIREVEENFNNVYAEVYVKLVAIKDDIL